MCLFDTVQDIINRCEIKNFYSKLMKKEVEKQGKELTADTVLGDRELSSLLLNQILVRYNIYKFQQALNNMDDNLNAKEKTQREYFLNLIKQINTIYANFQDNFNFDFDVEMFKTVLEKCYKINKVIKNNTVSMQVIEQNEVSDRQKKSLISFEKFLNKKCKKINCEQILSIEE